MSNNFLESKYPIIGGAMSWVSNSTLVSAITNSGCIGVFATSSLPLDKIHQEILAIHAQTNKPAVVNIVLMRKDIDELVELCIQCKVGAVVLAAQVPNKNLIQKLKSHNIKTIAFVPSALLAKRLIRHGIDALILEGSEAGGHIGKISTAVLMQEVLVEIHNQVPVYVAGGVVHGSLLRTAQSMGAAGVQIGTLFAASKESPASESFKNALVRASGRDTVVTYSINDKFPVLPVRLIKNKAFIEFMSKQTEVLDKYLNKSLSLEDAIYELEIFWTGSLYNAVIKGDIENGSIMAGQGVGSIKGISSVSEIVNEFIEQSNKLI